MSIKLKALGLALVAACAISAIAASSASATGERFTSNKEHTIPSGSSIGSQVVTTTVGNTECTGVSVDEATMVSTSMSEVTVKSTFSGCSSIIGGSTVPIRVTMTSCDVRFTSEVPAGKEHAEIHIDCTTVGDEVDVEAKFLGVFVQCLKFPAQTTTGGGVTYASSGTEHIKIKATATGIKYTEVGACGSGTINNGTYSGEVTVSGKNTEGVPATLSYP